MEWRQLLERSVPLWVRVTLDLSLGSAADGNVTRDLGIPRNQYVCGQRARVTTAEKRNKIAVDDFPVGPKQTSGPCASLPIS